MMNIAIVAEGDVDRGIAVHIVDLVIRELLQDSDADLEAVRSYVQINGRPFLKWTEAKHLAARHGIKHHGTSAGADHHAAVRALWAIRKCVPDVNVVLLQRDADDQPQRRTGLDAARQELHGMQAILVGLATPKIEAWILRAFTVTTANEEAAHSALREQLGFDAITNAHQLEATTKGAKRHIKRVLAELTGSDAAACWHPALSRPLDDLRTIGTNVSLSTFIADVVTRIEPLLPKP